MGVPEVTVATRELRADIDAVFERLARTGDLVWLAAGEQRLLLVNGADAAREVLIDRAAELVKPRSQTIDLGPPRPEVVDGRIPPRPFRRALAKGLGTNRDADVVVAVEDAVARETAGWRDGARLAVMPAVRRIGVRVACAGMLGVAVGDREVERTVDALRRLDELPRGVAGGGRAGRLTRAGLRRARAAGRLAAVAATLLEHLDPARPGELGAVAYDLPQLAPEVTPAERRRLAGELLLGATGPLVQTSGWLLARLASAPDEERALRAEWAEELPPGPLDPSVLPRLRRTLAFVREVTRLHPTNPRITRAAVADTAVGGERVPAHTRVVLNVNAVNRDPHGYSEPERFDPGRWLDGRPTEHKLGYLSFGAGERRCLGEAAGLTALTALSPAVCRSWRIELDDVRVTGTGRRQLAEDTTASLRAC